MNQHINLYQKEKKKWMADFTFQYMVWFFGAFLGLLVIVSAYDVIQYLYAQKALDTLNKEQADKNKKLLAISGQVPEERTREQLLSEIKKYETEKQTKQEIISVLAAQTNQISGFSEYFDSLSKQVMPGLWLTGFSFKDNGASLSLEGSTLKPEYVPQLITKLSAEPAFKGKTFHLFKISLDEKTKRINFILETKVMAKHE
jgi:Tfp pilus assembly protein PilN